MRPPVAGRVTRRDVLNDLGSVDWATIPAGYSDGPEVESLLRRLVNLDPGPDRDEVFDNLWQGLLHQGTVSPATAPALPFVVAIAEAAEHPLRNHLLALVAGCTYPVTRFDDQGMPRATPDDPARNAVQQLLPRLIAMADTDQLARPWTAMTLAAFTDNDVAAAAQILRRWHTEALSADEAAVYCLALLTLGERTRKAVDSVRAWSERRGEDIDPEPVRRVLESSPRSYEALVYCGDALFDAAVFVTLT